VAEETIIQEKNMELQMIEAYKEGLKELERGDALYAARKFNEAEVLFPQSDYAPKAALMAAYSYYTQNYYGDAVAELERFIKIYPNHYNISYAEYLLGLCFYEQIIDEKKDLQSIDNAKAIFSNIIKKYPSTDFAIDANFKLDLINDILAAKEIYIGRYYFDKKMDSCNK
jgi:outer membrane protein assembly factor BamD